MITEILCHLKKEFQHPIIRNIILFGPCSILLHWLSTNLYTSFCVQKGFWGFIYSFITIISPQCVLLTTLMNFSFNYYTMLWKYIIGSIVVFGSMLLKKIILK